MLNNRNFGFMILGGIIGYAASQSFVGVVIGALVGLGLSFLQ